MGSMTQENVCQVLRTSSMNAFRCVRIARPTDGGASVVSWRADQCTSSTRTGSRSASAAEQHDSLHVDNGSRRSIDASCAPSQQVRWQAHVLQRVQLAHAQTGRRCPLPRLRHHRVGSPGHATEQRCLGPSRSDQRVAAGLGWVEHGDAAPREVGAGARAARALIARLL